MTRFLNVLANAYLDQGRPLSLVHFVTRRCNARCAHCFIDFDSPGSEDDVLSIAEIETMAAHLRGALVNVNLTGGEPFLNRDLWPICRAYYRHAEVASVHITTHGGFPSRIAELLDRFAAEGPAAQALFISISIDDFPAEHDRGRRVEGLFERAIESHALVRAHADPRVGVGLSITVAEHNHERVVPLYRMLRERHGATVIGATLVREQGVKRAPDEALRRRIGAAYSELTRAIEADLASQPREGARRSLAGRMQDAKDRILYRMLREDASTGSRYRSTCPAASLFVVIEPDGAVHGCEVRGDSRLGHLREHGLDLPALLASAPARGWRRDMRAGHCHCTYECALGINIVSHPRYVPELLAGLWKTAGDG